MNKTKKLVFAALMAAVTCIATMVIKIPTPTHGYVNLGDCMVLLSGWLLGPAYGFLAAGIGSALADMVYGYYIYAPATFIIKGAMALVAYYLCYKLNMNKFAIALSAICAEALMVAGYLIYELALYGKGAFLGVLANVGQGLVGAVIGIILISILPQSVKSKLK